MDKSSLLERVVRREKKLHQARRFRQRLLADDPKLEQLLPALNHARRFVMPRGEGSEQLVEGGLDSVRLDVDEKTMSAGWVISAVNRDRYGDVVVPDGCVDTLDDYRKNPQVFFAHKSNDMPIGLCEHEDKFHFEVRDEDILSRCFFHGATEESDKVFDLVAKHILRAASIGFLPIYGEVIPGGEPYEEGDTEVDFDMGGLCFQKWSIIEWSVVSVPANPDALRSWLCQQKSLRSHTLKKSLEPFATPLKKNQVRGGWDTLEHKAVKEKKKFDIRKQKLRPASLEIDFAAKHIGCEIKELHQRHVFVPGAKVGGFLCGWRNATSQIEEVDVRNITYDGREQPPVREIIQLNSTKSDDFLTDGIVFYQKEDDRRFVLSIQPSWGGLFLRFFSGRSDSAKVLALVAKAWELASTDYNFLKGEAFSLSGKFLPKTDEKFEDVFLSEKNTSSIKRTLTQFNKKKQNFTNRGAIWMGSPGNGKTLSGRIIRNQAEATFIWISARDFYNYGSFGGFEYAFELAKELAPTVLFFEDIDNWMSRTSIDYLKSEMDGIGRSKGIWTILTTNFPEHLPEALIDRPGRFHDVLRFAKPSEDTRRLMLVKWLPNLSADSTAKVVKATKGYSGAHIFELCHFAKTLCEDDEAKTLDIALEEAIKKIAEQRQVIQNPYEEKSAVKILTRSNPFLSYRYAGGRTRRKHNLVASLSIRKELKRMVPNEEPTKDNVSEGEDYGEESCQAVVLQPSVFPTEDDCVQWLNENGYEADRLVPGDEAEDPWIAVQFDADLCELDTARREPAEDGVELVYCVKKDDEDDEEEESPDDRYTQDGDQVDVVGDPKPARSVGRNTKTRAVKNKRLAADEEESDEDEALETSQGDDTENDEEEVGEAPYGAKVLRNTHERMKKLHGHLVKSIKVLEHDGVKKYLGKLQGHVEKHMNDIQCTGAKHYPDHFQEEETKAEEPPDENEDMESGVGKSASRLWAEDDLTVLKDVAEFFGELSESDKLTKSQLTLCRIYKDTIQSLDTPAKACGIPSKGATTDPAAFSKAYRDAQEQVKQISDLIYSLTGQEIDL